VDSNNLLVMASERRITATIAIPNSLFSAIERIALKDNDNISTAICKLICKSLNVDTSILVGSRKRREIIPPRAAVELKHTESPWPNDFYELSQTRYRPRIHYNILLGKSSKRWRPHDPGKSCPADCPALDNDKNHPLITDQEREDMKYLRDNYAYSY